MKHFLDWVVLERVCSLLPLRMRNQFLRRDIIFPFLTLQHAEDEAGLVIVAVRDGDVIFGAILAKCLQLGLFLIAKLDVHKDKALVLTSTLDGQELLLDRGFECLNLLVEMVENLDLLLREV